jgi:hypothetical protein
MSDSFKDLMKKNRDFLKDSIRKSVDFSKTEQSNGVDIPAIEKPIHADAELINLVVEENWENIYDAPLARTIKDRISHRNYKNESLSLEELSFLLWATQGVRMVQGGYAFRNVPSAGCRHSMETYLAVFNVDGLDEGIYRYLPFHIV